MKKLITLLVILMLALSCNSSTATTPAITLVMPHGHSENADGGTLKIAGTLSTYTTGALVIAPEQSSDIPFNVNTYDTVLSHQTLPSATFTVPSGYTYAKVIAGATLIGQTSNGAISTMNVFKNSSPLVYGGIKDLRIDSTYSTYNQIATPIFPVIAGDTIKLRITNSDVTNTLTVGHITTWIMIEFFR